MESAFLETAHTPQAAETSGDTVAARFERQAADTPNHLALVTDEVSLTYHELDALADRIAAVLGELVSGPERPVALMIDDVTLFIASMIAALKAGRIFIPLESNAPQSWLAGIVRDSGATHIVSDHATRAVADRVAGADTTVIEIARSTPPERDLRPRGRVSPNAVACIMYTSGSTGRPKGVALTHRGLLHRCDTRSDRSGLVPGDRVAHLRSNAFIAGKTNIFATLLNGACAMPFDIRAKGLQGLGPWLNLRKITSFNMTGSLFRAWLATLDDRSRFPSLRTIACGSEPLYANDIVTASRHLEGEWKIVHSCGATELGAFASGAFGPSSLPDAGVLPVGRILGGYDVWLENGTGRVSGPGETGEIVIKSAYLADCYWNEPELTAAAFRKDPTDGSRIYRTGDLGRWRPDSQLEHLGRKDRKIKLNGHSIELHEVECALLRLPGVNDVIVVVDENGPDDKRLVAYVARSDGAAAQSIATLRSQMLAQVPRHMVPSHFVVLTSMPLTPRGKIDRKALPSLPKSAKEPRTSSRAPTNDIEHKLSLIWQDVLKTGAIGIDDNFYELGGTSLQAFQIFARIAEECDTDLPPTSMLDAPTIERQAILLGDASAARASKKVLTFRAGGKRSPLFIVHDAFGGIMFVRELVRDLKSDRPVHGFLPPPLDGVHPVPRTVEEIAAGYLAEIRRVQPSGPYCLAGYSFGGFVALEMAQQLVRNGEQVSFLGIIDTGFDHRHEVAGEVLSSRIRRHMGRFRRGSVFAYLRTRLVKTLWDRAQTGCDRLLNLPRELRLAFGYAIPFEDRPLFYRQVYHCSNRRYSPKPYHGPITMFAGTKAAGLQRARLETIARGGLTMHEIPASHAQIVWPPYSIKLAECFDRSLDAIP